MGKPHFNRKHHYVYCFVGKHKVWTSEIARSGRGRRGRWFICKACVAAPGEYHLTDKAAKARALKTSTKWKRKGGR